MVHELNWILLKTWKTEIIQKVMETWYEQSIWILSQYDFLELEYDIINKQEELLKWVVLRKFKKKNRTIYLIEEPRTRLSTFCVEVDNAWKTISGRILWGNLDDYLKNSPQQ